MYIVHKIHEQWLNGNHKDAIKELAKLGSAGVREFLSYLSEEDKGTAMIVVLNELNQVQSELDYGRSRG